MLYRLKIASGTDRQYFTAEALDEVFRFSGGVPRLINSICDSALLNGFIYEKDTIDGALMREVVSESPMVQIGSQGDKQRAKFDEDLQRLIVDNTN
ncbi:MAG: hypothetical protein A3C36_04705 [Omnitrophica WOR_2 bacterium RIFCSPHIGHO2_02_FULL_52_10]|nr:MAG: hypothetical protein A3C36_04705 [Omnitrophica WOR_2 bacterium RIFCSPHIGHO2_02_FULL_52_10]